MRRTGVRPSHVLTALPALALALVLVTTSAPSVAGAGVERAQLRLNSLGCDAGPVDGVLGDWTRAALVRFQSRHRLVQSGRLDDTTRERLYGDRARRCDARPVPARSGTGRRIVLSQRQNWLWLVRADGSVAAQGGVVDNAAELARGSYRTGSYCGRAARVRHNTSGDLWLDHFVRFAPCGYGFHRIPRSMSTGAQIHADWLLGTDFRQSHGCIRLSRRMAERVWDFTAVATTTVRVV